MLDVAGTIEELEACGGRLTLRGERIGYSIPKSEFPRLKPIVEALRSQKEEVLRLLRQRDVSSSPRDLQRAQPKVQNHLWTVSEALRDDPYWQVAQSALARISEVKYIPGTIPWLEKNHPLLYQHLVRDLPDEVDRLWDLRAPLNEFEAVLNKWVDVVQQVVAVFGVSSEEKGVGR